MDSAESWREVGAKLEAIGLKLRLHYEQEHEPEPDDDRDAVTKFVGAIDDAFDALGNAAEDDAVKADVRDAGQALTNALAATFASVSRSAREALARDNELAPAEEPEGAAAATAVEPEASTEPEPTEPEPAADDEG